VQAKKLDLAPEVTRAYQAARAKIPPEEAPPSVLEPNPLDESLRQVGTADIDIQRNPGGGFDVTTREGILYAETEEQAKALLEKTGRIHETSAPIEGETPEQTAARILNLTQRRASIAQTVAAQLREAGRPVEEANAAGALIQAHYQARASRFGGALGTARELFDKEAPTIVRDVGTNRGALNLSNNVITLFRNADASTFVHETGHAWLEEMLRDAQHPAAPDELKADLASVKEWLGTQGETPSRAEHERFARGFERYLMEGTAPTEGLARVFSKFKQWLTSIYQTVARLRVPINDSIRGVYDRLLSDPRAETIIAPERDIGRDFADVHEADAAGATPENAIERATRSVGNAMRPPNFLHRR
jgi:hypothetical protein